MLVQSLSGAGMDSREWAEDQWEKLNLYSQPLLRGLITAWAPPPVGLEQRYILWELKPWRCTQEIWVMCSLCKSNTKAISPHLSPHPQKNCLPLLLQKAIAIAIAKPLLFPKKAEDPCFEAQAHSSPVSSGQKRKRKWRRWGAQGSENWTTNELTMRHAECLHLCCLRWNRRNKTALQNARNCSPLLCLQDKMSSLNPGKWIGICEK